MVTYNKIEKDWEYPFAVMLIDNITGEEWEHVIECFDDWEASRTICQSSDMRMMTTEDDPEDRIEVMMPIGMWMKRSQRERTAHLDLESPCIPSLALRDGKRIMKGQPVTKAHGSAMAKEELRNFHGVADFGGNQIHTCHRCDNHSQAPNGFVCKNPRHVYFGTVAENYYDKDPKERTTAKAIANGNHVTQQLVKCVHCGYEHMPMVIGRHHNDNCKWRNKIKK